MGISEVTNNTFKETLNLKNYSHSNFASHILKTIFFINILKIIINLS